ncbi:hypothetical protein NDN08_004203 [Rhodosorus marinus]|uniref:Uncharacterized protein n=1 Tax=Rhodosorus marinus TaxID=101924 RepID=A0AAV8ULF3_9RHOD|nr:hypothetical protein NDN08_004203 [Rhodosorus marinus]
MRICFVSPAKGFLTISYSGSTSNISRRKYNRVGMKSRKSKHLEQLLDTLKLDSEEKEVGATWKPPHVLVLVGIPGAGKTTFASRLVERGWVRVCQDVLGTRTKCERVATSSIMEGKNIVIDRCNFNRKQREPWVRIAEAGKCQIGTVVFALAWEACLERVLDRAYHETLTPERADSVIRGMASEMHLPRQEEGFDFGRIIRTRDDFESVFEEVCSEQAR